MKTQLLLAATAALLAPIPVSQDSPDDPPPRGKLIRVEVQGEPDSADATQARIHLDREQVITMLTAADLDRRESHFDLLVRASRVDREVLQLLTDIAASRVDVELAWTARLALREAKRGSRFFGFPSSPFVAGRGTLQDLFLPGVTDLQGFGLFGGGFPEVLLGPGASGLRHGIELQKDDEGVVLRIHEQRDGEEETTRAYRGESWKAILEANPELKELNIRVQEIDGGMLLHMDPPRRWNQFEKMVEEMRRGRPDVFRLFTVKEPGDLKDFLQPFRTSRPVDPRILGVRAREISTARAEELGLEEGVGLYVDWVEPGSMAHILGVGTGSVLLELNDQPLRTDEDITTVLEVRAPEDTVHLLWIDGAGEKRTNVWRPGK